MNASDTALSQRLTAGCFQKYGLKPSQKMKKIAMQRAGLLSAWIFGIFVSVSAFLVTNKINNRET